MKFFNLKPKKNKSNIKPFSFTKRKTPFSLNKRKTNKPFKFKPVNISKNNTKNLIFGFDIPKTKRKIKGKKALNWTQAKIKFPKLAPLGDADKDGIKNWLDCRPFDPTRQAVKKTKPKYKPVNIDKHNWAFKRDKKGKIKVRLGNHSDAGWVWSGENEEVLGATFRLNDSKIRKEFIDTMKEKKVPLKQLKPILIKGAKKGEGLYEISGDNNRWEFGENDEFHTSNAIENLEIKDRDKRKEFEEYYSENVYKYSNDDDNYNYDKFEKDNKKEYSKKILKAINESEDYEDFFDKTNEIEESIREDLDTEEITKEHQTVKSAYDDWKSKKEEEGEKIEDYNSENLEE